MEATEIVLLLGGNLGDSRGYIRNALSLLEQRLGTIFHQSYFYKTTSWGFNSSDFLNLAVSIDTNLEALDCLAITQEIEEELGRYKYNDSDGYSDRSIDIDIMFYGHQIIETKNLTIPHPRIQERNFVLIPLAEIIPDFQHPILKLSISELTQKCKDTSKVIKLNEQV